MRVILDVVEGPNRGKSFAFDRRQIEFIGRAMDCGAYCLAEDVEVSRKHALLDVNPPRCSIRDLGSKNHTFINGRKVNNGELREGDVVQLGPNTLLIMRIDGSGSHEVYEEEDRFIDSKGN